MFDKETVSLLSINTQKAGKTAPSYSARLANIKWILNLYIDDLEYKKREKQILIKKVNEKKELYLQIPGKESAREEKQKRPYDFFPVIVNTDSNTTHRDLAFTELWVILESLCNSIKQEDRYIIQLLAVLLYRMAFMIDHKLQESHEKVKVRYLEYNPKYRITETEEILPARYVYQPPKKIIDIISGKINKIFDVEFETFLYYLEVLSWNEDCKYFYANSIKGKKAWIDKVGRVNNILTMVSYLGINLKAIKLSKIFGAFAIHGVSNINDEDIIALSDGLIKPE